MSRYTRYTLKDIKKFKDLKCGTILFVTDRGMNALSEIYNDFRFCVTDPD